MGAVYRILLPLLLWTTAVVSAPQEATNSEITYIKIEPIIDDTPVKTPDNQRRSRIEKLPLTIPGNITQPKKELESNQTELKINPKFKRSDNRSKEDSRENTSQEKPKKFQRKYTFGKRPKTTTDNESNKVEPVNKITETTTNASINKITESTTNASTKSELSDFANSDTTERVEKKPVIEFNVSQSSEESHEANDDILTDKSEIDPTAVDFISDSIAAESNKFEKQFLEITTTNYDTNDPGTVEVTTVKLEAKSTTRNTVQLENQTKPTFTKLGYFGKSYTTSLNNFIERTGKRRFRSSCRCEKIWNCPKLQITVPRCPDEYFLCCF